MYIRRKVFSLLQDETGEERYFSTTDVTLENEEERTFSVAEDAESLEEKDFSDKKKEEDDEPKLTTSDKINIKLNKALTTKKDREAFVEAFEDGKSHKYGKQAAKYAAIGSGISGGILGAVVGGKRVQLLELFQVQQDLMLVLEQVLHLISLLENIVVVLILKQN